MTVHQTIVHVTFLEAKSYISCGFSLDFNSADYRGSSALALLYTPVAVFTLLTFRQQLLVTVFFT